MTIVDSAIPLSVPFRGTDSMAKSVTVPISGSVWGNRNARPGKERELLTGLSGLLRLVFRKNFLWSMQ